MSSSDRDTTRLLARAARVWGRPVVTCRPPRPGRPRSEATAALSRCPRLATRPGGMRPASAVTSHDAALTGSPPGPSADGLTSIGP